MISKNEFINKIMLTNTSNDIEVNSNHLLNLIDKLYEGNEAYDFSVIKKDNSVLLDCGANVGVVSIFFALKFPNSRVFAIEASPSTYKVLKKNIEFFNLKDRVFAYNYALAEDDKGMIEFYEKTNFSIGSTISKKHADFDKELFNANSEKISVKKMSLNKFIKINKIRKIDFLKCDIEYAEYEFFNKVNFFNWFKIKKIAIETHGDYFKQVDLLFKLSKKLGIENVSFEMQNFDNCLSFNRSFSKRKEILSRYKNSR